MRSDLVPRRFRGRRRPYRRPCRVDAPRPRVAGVARLYVFSLARTRSRNTRKSSVSAARSMILVPHGIFRKIFQVPSNCVYSVNECIWRLHEI